MNNKQKEKLYSVVTTMLVSLLCAVNMSCGDDPEPSEVNVNPASLSFDSGGGSLSFNVTSNSSWKISCSNSWIQVSLPQGKGNQQVVVLAASNPEQESRNGIINIVTEDGNDIKAVVVTQEGNPIDVNEVVNTTWKGNMLSSNGSVSLQLNFSTSTARMLISSGSVTGHIIDYSFTRSKNIVVLTPLEKDKNYAVLSGKIENGLTLTLKNTSDGSEIAVLYKIN